MLVYKKGEFTERADLAEVYEKIHGKHDDYTKALEAAGFQRSSSYYTNNNIYGLGIEVCVRCSNASPISREYGYLVEWGIDDGFGTAIDVLIADVADFYDFLGRYLPVVKLAGELLTTEDL